MTRRLNSLTELRAFRTAARLLSFTRAADELNLSQGAVSRQIKHLEDTLGVQLFHRYKKSIQLTEEGRQLLPEVTSALDLLDRASDAVTRSAERPSLTVRVPPTLAMRWLIPRLRDFREKHPEIEVQLATSLGATMKGFDLARDRIDIAIARISSPRSDRKLHFDHLMADDHVPVCSRNLLFGDHPLRCPGDLVHHELLHAVTRPRAWRSWLDYVGLERVDAERGLFFDHYHFVLQAAIDGLGVAVAPRPLVESDMAEGRLVVPFNVMVPSGTAYYIVSRTEAFKNRSVRTFHEWLLLVAGKREAALEAQTS